MADQWVVELWRRGYGDEWFLVNPAVRGPFSRPTDAYMAAGLLDSFNNPMEDHRVRKLYVGRHRRRDG